MPFPYTNRARASILVLYSEHFPLVNKVVNYKYLLSYQELQMFKKLFSVNFSFKSSGHESKGSTNHFVLMNVHIFKYEQTFTFTGIFLDQSLPLFRWPTELSLNISFLESVSLTRPTGGATCNTSCSRVTCLTASCDVSNAEFATDLCCFGENKLHSNRSDSVSEFDSKSAPVMSHTRVNRSRDAAVVLMLLFPAVYEALMMLHKRKMWTRQVWPLKALKVIRKSLFLCELSL